MPEIHSSPRPPEKKGPEPRLIDFTINPGLEKILRKDKTQVVNLVAGGNVPESPESIVRALHWDPVTKKLPSIDEIGKEEVQKTIALLQTIDDLPMGLPGQLDMRGKLTAYNADDTTEKKLRFIDTPANIQSQYVAFREKIRKIIDNQDASVEDIVFTVCGASPPDLQAIRAIQALNKEFAAQRDEGFQRPNLFVSVFIPGDEDAVIGYSVKGGLHPDFWMEAYREAKADQDHVFIHEPHPVPEFADKFPNPYGLPLEQRRVSFQDVRKVSMDIFKHNRGALTDVNRTLTRLGAKPPTFALVAESFATPKQLPGSGLDLVARYGWLLTEFYGMSDEEAFMAVMPVQSGFLHTEEWSLKRFRQLLDQFDEQLRAEEAAGIWPQLERQQKSSTNI